MAFMTLQFSAKAQGTSTLTNLALNKVASASSIETSSLTAASAFDGDMNTRFSSSYDDNQWVSIDLGRQYLITSLSIVWERAYGKDFNIVFSNNGTYTDLYADSIQIRNNTLTTNSIAGTNNITMKANTIARYVRMQGVRRATGWGYSIWEFQVLGLAAATLPVSLTGFTAAAQKNETVLTWTTVTEYNNAGFYVERSNDGAHFSSIGWVEGRNTGSVVSNYSFSDKEPVSGNSYYRLKQVDIDGKAAYSPIVTISNVTTASVKAYPVPVKDHLVIEYKGTTGENISIALYNATGQVVYNNKVTIQGGQQSMMINRTANMTSGIYFLKIQSSSNKEYTQQIVLQ